MRFVLFEKLAELEGTELVLLIAAVVAAAVLIVVLCVHPKRRSEAAAAEGAQEKFDVRAMVFGALCVALSFMLSYIKLFSMPLGGSVTLASMLPVCLYAKMYGPRRGFIAALCYALLQIIQGAYIVHWAQFLLDYVVAFGCYGLASFFKKSLPAGILVSGAARFAASLASGLIFFSEYAAEAGYQSAVAYSLIYNASTIGVDVALCVVIALLPPVKKAFARLETSMQGA